MRTVDKQLTVKALESVDTDVLLGAKSILLLPLNWGSSDGEEVYAESTDSVAKLFFQSGIPSQTLSPISAETNLKQDRYADWVAPTLFVSSLLIQQNPMAVSLALNVLGNYVTEVFRGIKADPAVKLRIVQSGPRGKTVRQINYEGPVSGLEGVAKVVAEFKSED